MRRGEEFATWLAARWPALVRTLVFLGHPQPEAERVAGEAVARMLPAWDRERRDGDVDALVYRALLDERERVIRRGGDAAGAAAGRAGPAARAGRPARAAPRARGVPRHAPRRRAGADRPGPRGRARRGRGRRGHRAVGRARRRCRWPAPTCATPARRSRRRRPRSPGCWRARAAGGVRRGPAARPSPRCVAVVLARDDLVDLGRGRPARAGGGHAGDEPAAASRGTPTAPCTWPASPCGSPASTRCWTCRTAWSTATPRGASSTSTTPAGSGRSARPWPGRGSPSSRTTGGSRGRTRATATPSWSSTTPWRGPRSGAARWASAGDGGGQPVGAAGPIAIDDERVFYSSPDGDFAWEPPIDVSFALSGTMVDTAEDARVTRSDDVLRVTPLPYRTGVVIDADDARLTHDGRYAFGVQEADAFDQLEVFDVETGRPVPPLYSPSDEAVSWTYQDGHLLLRGPPHAPGQDVPGHAADAVRGRLPDLRVRAGPATALRQAHRGVRGGARPAGLPAVTPHGTPHETLHERVLRCSACTRSGRSTSSAAPRSAATRWRWSTARTGSATRRCRTSPAGPT